MKVVLFSQRVEVIDAYQERRDCADQRIADYICHCGYLPIPVPNSVDLVKSYVDTLKPCGIVLTGGNSLISYGGNAPERDLCDKELVHLATENRIPLYGFCRGMQSILDYFGCQLINVEGHTATRHNITGLFGKHIVNSYHNQGCVQLAQTCGLEITASSPDGVIEAVHHKNFPILATMWHPEREFPYSVFDINNLKNLFQ